MRIIDWSSDVCSSDLGPGVLGVGWVAVLRCDLAQLATLFRWDTRRGNLAAPFPATEQFRQAVALFLDQCRDALAHGGDGLALLQRGLDRKSTRLNSSH